MFNPWKPGVSTNEFQQCKRGSTDPSRGTLVPRLRRWNLTEVGDEAASNELEKDRIPRLSGKK